MSKDLGQLKIRRTVRRTDANLQRAREVRDAPFLLLLFNSNRKYYFDFYLTFCLSYIYHLLADFKKASTEDKLSLFNSLLKGYQEEVDNLTKRAKYGENAFLNIYQKLYEAPDPYPVIASIAVSSTLVFHMITFLTELWSNCIGG